MRQSLFTGGNIVFCKSLLIVSKEEVDSVMDFLHREIQTAMKHF